MKVAVLPRTVSVPTSTASRDTDADLPLMPAEVLGNQYLNIRIDREFCGVENHSPKHQEGSGNDDRPPVSGAVIDDADDR